MREQNVCNTSLSPLLPTQPKTVHTDGFNTLRIFRSITIYLQYDSVKGKAILLQALASPEGSRRMRLPDFKAIGT
jgi:hypothetical protein